VTLFAEMNWPEAAVACTAIAAFAFIVYAWWRWGPEL